jgi:hypothetical protein
MTPSRQEFQQQLASGAIDLDLISNIAQRIELNISTYVREDEINPSVSVRVNLLTGEIENNSNLDLSPQIRARLQQFHNAQIDVLREALNAQIAQINQAIVTRAELVRPVSDPVATIDRLDYNREVVMIEEEWELWDKEMETSPPPPPKTATATAVATEIPDWEEYWHQHEHRMPEPTLLPAPATIIDSSATAERWEKFVPECVGLHNWTIDRSPRQRSFSGDLMDLDDLLAELNRD